MMNVFFACDEKQNIDADAGGGGGGGCYRK